MQEETLDLAYQPPAPDRVVPHGILQRYRFVPPNAGPNAKLPTVLMFPPDVFYLEYEDHGNPGEMYATYDLQQAGFLVFQVDHRLAAPGALDGQMSSGISPAQYDDAERQILAALADPQCNGSIYLVGGSAGGCLALWCALDSATHTATGWNNAARLHIKAVVSFSGPTDLSNWDHPGLTDAQYLGFKQGADRYAGLPFNPDPTYDYTILHNASPVSLITSGLTCAPVKLYGSTADSVSYVQQDEMKTALTGVALVVTERIFPGDAHAYQNWHVVDTVTNNCVSADVINFLHTYP